MPVRRCRAFAPGRVNLIGEHTDYNQGLALPFAIAQGVTVEATIGAGQPARIEAAALDLGEHDSFPLERPPAAEGWRAFVHGAVAELQQAGHPLVGAGLQITGGVPRGSGLSSSAALTVSLCLALLELAAGGQPIDRVELARLCSRVENGWTGAQTGLLDQLASLFGAADSALLIDFMAVEVTPVPMALGGWRLVVADSGERHAHATSGYNERRAECAAACRILGVDSLRRLDPDRSEPSDALDALLARLPQPLRGRVAHVLGENRRVDAAVAALAAGEPGRLGALLSASHTSLRDLFEISTAAVERTVAGLIDAGAAGARLIGGGFGGSVLALFAPEVPLPADCLEVSPGPGAVVTVL